MAPARRPGPVPVAPAGPNFLDLGFYSGGFMLPPGRYAMEHNIVLHSFTDRAGNTKGDPKLGVMLNAYPLDGGEPVQQFISMGTKAHLSYMPNESGKGLVAIPGGPGMVSNKANWFYYLESLMNCGANGQVTGNDISVLDGVWVVTDNVPEPEDRKGFASTGEVENQGARNNKMVVVTEIIDGGKPWEGGGGFPEAGKPVAGAAASAAPAAAARPAARPAARTAPAAVAPVAASVDGDALYTAAVNGIASVLSKAQNAKGTPMLMLKTGTFKAVTDAESGETAQQVIDLFFGADQTRLASILDEVGFQINGVRVEPK